MSGDAALKRRRRLLLVPALLLGILFDYFFYGKPLGVSYPLYVLLLYGAFFYALRGEAVPKPGAGRLLFLPVFALALTFALYVNRGFMVLNFLLLPLLLIAHTVIAAGGNRFAWCDIRFVADILEGLFGRTLGNIAAPFRALKELLPAGTEPGRYETVKKVAAGLAVSAPLLLVVVLLLSSADVVFGHYLGRLPEFLGEIINAETVWRIIFGLAVAVIAFAYIYSFMAQAGTARSEPAPLTIKPWLDPVTAITVLVMVNLVYTAFAVIQFSYLFGGGGAALPAGFTYAEYARQGFFQLLVVAVINLSLLAGTVAFVKKEGKTVNGSVRFFMSLLVVSTLVMLYSAHYRLSLYEAAYGYTYARLLAHAFMLYLLVLLSIFAVRVWKENINLLQACIVVTLGAYIILNFTGIDTLIARNNIERYQATGKIDPYYLTILAHDAVPQLARLVDDEDEEVAAVIRSNLYVRKMQLSREPQWQSFNYFRYRAARVLAGIKLSPP